MFLNFIILFNYITFTLSYIILPININKPDIDSINSPIEVIQKISKSEIFTSFEIGSDKTKIKAILSHKINGLIIAGKNIKNHKYDESLSKSYICANNEIKKLYTSFPDEEFLLSKENFYMLNDTNKIQNLEQINFLLEVKTSNDNIYEGIFGIQFPYLNGWNDYSLISILKTKKIINSYSWFLSFDNQGKGKMYIGAQPHNIYKTLEEKNFKLTSGSQNGYWALDFSEILYNNDTKLRKSYQAYIHFDFKFFLGPNELMEILEKEFFKNYMTKNICFKEIYGYERNIFYYCKNTKEFNPKKLKEINFKNVQLESNFVFDYNDLFFYKDDLAYFLILFREIDINSFRIGEIFLKKYNLVFNHDSKMIGFYSNINDNKIENKNIIKDKGGSNFSLTNILLIIILVCILILGLFFFKRRLNRKIRANELEDKYSYIAKNSESEFNEINL